MTERVVITGLGVVAPNANGLGNFELALQKGLSGIRRRSPRVSDALLGTGREEG